MTTGNLWPGVPQPKRARYLRENRGSSQTMSKSPVASAFGRKSQFRVRAEEPIEYPANGSFSRHSAHAVASALRRKHEKKNGQASRVISTGKLHVSLRFHTQPISLVIFQDPLEALRPGKSHLGECFTLRCVQRFSLPNVTTRRYPWQDNRYIRGSFNPVLSY